MGPGIYPAAHRRRPLHPLWAMWGKRPRLPRAPRDCRAQGFMLDWFRASAAGAGSPGRRAAVGHPQPAGGIVVLSFGVGEWLRSGSPLLAAVAAGDALLMASRRAASTFLVSLTRFFPRGWAFRSVD